ncbi:hypothetical protein ACO0R3_002380 [Hanseniaspora guilliermondii]
MSLEFTIKHAGKMYPTVLEDGATGLDLRNKIEELLSIPSQRQRYLTKLGKLTDTCLVKDIIAPGSTVTLIGTATKDLIKKPTDAHIKELQNSLLSTNKKLKTSASDETKDLTFLDESNDNKKYNVGFKNGGNTCYLNSSIHALYQIESIRNAVLGFDTKNLSSADINIKLQAGLISELKNVFTQMSSTTLDKIYPLGFIIKLRETYPQFKEIDRARGIYKQQDAEEFFSLVLSSIDVCLPNATDCMKLDFLVKITDTNEPSDVTYNTTEDYKLRCHISIKTNFLIDGLENSMKEFLTKKSAITEADSKFKYESKITKLPTYLTVQFVRFFWKKETSVKSKILRKVAFPFELDVSTLLEETYQKDKVKIRDELRKILKDEEEALTKFKAENNVSRTPNGISKIEYQNLSITEKKEKWREEYEREKSIWDELKKKVLDAAPINENPSSVYELQSVIAHQGSNSESGHYQAFVRDPNDKESWLKYNDDKVTKVSKEKIEALAGGGEGDTALILIYKGLGL